MLMLQGAGACLVAGPRRRIIHCARSRARAPTRTRSLLRLRRRWKPDSSHRPRCQSPRRTHCADAAGYRASDCRANRLGTLALQRNGAQHARRAQSAARYLSPSRGSESDVGFGMNWLGPHHPLVPRFPREAGKKKKRGFRGTPRAPDWAPPQTRKSNGSFGRVLPSSGEATKRKTKNSPSRGGAALQDPVRRGDDKMRDGSPPQGPHRGK